MPRGDVKGIPEVNHVAIFSHVIWLCLIRDEPLEKRWWVEGGGEETEGKCPPKKFMQMTGARVSDAASKLMAGGKISGLAARDSQARLHMYTGYKYPAN